MNPYLYVAPFLVLAGVVFVITWRHRLTGSVPASRYALASDLRPFISCGDTARCLDSEELWEHIQRAGGLPVIFRAAGEILTEALRIKAVVPDSASLATRALVISLELRAVLIVCLGESVMCKYLPILPRVFAWVVARLYCDLISTLQAMPTTA